MHLVCFHFVPLACANVICEPFFLGGTGKSEHRQPNFKRKLQNVNGKRARKGT